MAERRFTERETSQVLKKAAELQSGSGDPRVSGLASESELKAAAREVGIDPAFVEQAIAELSDPGPGSRSGLWGGPMGFDHDSAFRGAIDEETWEETVSDLRRAFGEAGTIQQRGQTWEWSGTGGGIVPVTLAIRQVGETVKMSGSMKTDSMAALYYVMSLIPLFIATGLASKVGRTTPVLAGVALLAWAVFVFWSARGLFSAGARQQVAKFQAVLQRARSRMEDRSVPHAQATLPEDEVQTVQA